MDNDTGLDTHHGGGGFAMYRLYSSIHIPHDLRSIFPVLNFLFPFFPILQFPIFGCDGNLT